MALFLQAYGLKKIVESLGHEVIFIDYHIGKPINKNGYYKAVLKNKILDLIVKTNAFILFFDEKKVKRLTFIKRYRDEFLPILGIKNKYQYNIKVDTLIIGSDEVFNCFQKNPNVGFSLELFGDRHNANKLISYAASFGNTTMEEIKKYGKYNELSNLFSQFNSISVRDENSKEIVDELYKEKINKNMDPVLMYDFVDEIPKCPEEDHILVYAYRRRLTFEEIEAIKKLAKKEKRKLIAIGGYQDFCDEYLILNPFEVLSYFKTAKYIITDTFHGIIFSLINNKKFVTFIREGTGNVYGNYQKISDLLKSFNLEERAILSIDKFEEQLYAEIDYDLVNDILKKERIKTKNYLKENL